MADITPEQRSRAIALSRSQREHEGRGQSKARRASRPGISFPLVYAAALLVALLSDGLDYIIGWIPFAGDVLDAFTLLFLLFIFSVYFLLGFRWQRLIPISIVAAAFLVELIPLADLFPTWAGAIVTAWRLERALYARKRIARRLLRKTALARRASTGLIKI